MSSTSESPPAKPKSKRNEEDIIREILKLQGTLVKDHHTPCLFTFTSKLGQMEFGSKNVVSKFKSDFNRDKEWEQAFLDYDNELIGGAQENDSFGSEDDYNSAKGSLLPKKLPADVCLMVYSGLWKWITQETIKEHWVGGGRKKCVKLGSPDFKPSFWLDDIWAWEEVTKHHRDLPKSAYTGPGIMTDFLKKVVERWLKLLGINPSMWVEQEVVAMETGEPEH